MTDAMPVLRSRGTVATPTREAHDVQMQRAAAIARATDMVPKSYRNNPGAVLLAMAWSESRDIDLVTTMQSVSFIQGKPFVSAEMQAAMAKRAGYRLVTEKVTDTSATVVILEGDAELGRETVTLEDAKRAGWTGDNWKKFPRNMLLARARTNAIRFYAPDVLMGVHAEVERDDVIGTDDAVAVLEDAPDQQDTEVVEAEVVEPEQTTIEEVWDGPITPATLGTAKAAYELAKTSENRQSVQEAMQAEEIPLNSRSWSERQGRRVIELCEAPA